jgi:peptidoglycan/LPS O-acetylase OafA/YrhL
MDTATPTGSPHPSSTAPSWGRRLVGIEGLRGLAALSVVIAHVRIHTAGDADLGLAGRVLGALDGLTLFFALSGFLLFRPFAASLVNGVPLPSTGRFLRNRALRVFPGYIVILLIASYVLQTTYTRAADAEDGFTGARDTLGPLTEWWHVLANLGMVQTLIPGSLKTGLGVAWSLTTELCFYLLLPVLAWAAAAMVRRGGDRLVAVWLVPAFLIALGVAGRLVAAATLTDTSSARVYAEEWGPTWHAVLQRSILPHADLFGYGAVAAVLFVLVEREVLRPRTVQALRVIATGAFLVVAAFLVGPGLPSCLGMRQWDTAPVAAACAALILWAALPTRRGTSSRLGKALEMRPLHHAGLVSYSLYLWHLPVLWWLAGHGLLMDSSPRGYFLNCLIVVGVTAALSSLTYHFVEAPALRLKKRTDGGRAAGVASSHPAAAAHTPVESGPVVPGAGGN